MRDLFIVGAKLMGIYIFFIHAITNLAFLIQVSQQEGSTGGYQLSVWDFLIVFALQTVVSYFLVFRTDLIANTIKLNPNDSPIGLSITTALQSGLILIGVYILITTMPILLQQITKEFIQGIMNFRFHYTGFIISLMKVFLSIVLIFASEKISSLIMQNQLSRQYQ